MYWLVKTGRAAISGLVGAGLFLIGSNALAEPAEAQPVAQSQLSFTCHFDAGPRAGQAQTYTGVSGPAVPIGVPCADGSGSTGVVVSDPTVTLPPAVQPPPVALPPAVQPPPQAGPATSFTCQFNNGPRAGEIQSYVGVTGMRPIPVGAECTDGQGSTGLAIPDALPMPPGKSFTCQFDNGPRAGQFQTYAGVTGMQPLPVGAPCADGQGSTGVAIPERSAPPRALPPPPPPPPPSPPPAKVSTERRRRSSSGLAATAAAREAPAIAGAAVGARVSGLPGAVWVDRNNDGYVDGYVYNGRYHAGTPRGSDQTAGAVAAGALGGAVLGASAGAAQPGTDVPAEAIVGTAVAGLAGARWADVNNDGVADGYYYRGQYHPGVPPTLAGAAAPAPAYVPPPPARVGERG